MWGGLWAFAAAGLLQFYWQCFCWGQSFQLCCLDVHESLLLAVFATSPLFLLDFHCKSICNSRHWEPPCHSSFGGTRLCSGGKKAKTGWSVNVPIGCLSQDCNAKKIVTFHTRLQLSQYDHTPKLYIGEFNTFHPSLSLLYLECAFIRVAAVCLLARPLSRILYTSSLSWTTSSSSPCMTTEP